MHECMVTHYSRLLALYPGPMRRKRAWYTLHAHAPGDPRKIWENRISSYVRPFTVHVYSYMSWTGHYGNATGHHGEGWRMCAQCVPGPFSPERAWVQVITTADAQFGVEQY